jgi:preprotein translocase subunit YajC
MSNIYLLAEATTNEAGTELGNAPGGTTPVAEPVNNAVEGAEGSAPPVDKVEPPTPGWMRFAPIIVLFVVMYFLLFRGPKKKQKKHTQMVKSIEKNARIQTIGGIIGTVMNVKDNEIVIKIDESNNTKMTITKGAVSTVLSNETK